MKLSIIIVNFQSVSYLKKCLESIEKSINAVLDFEVIVVNNDDQELSLRKDFPFPLKVIKNNLNSGFGAANNFGARVAQGEYLFFLNPDTKLVDDSLKKMVDFAEKEKATSIVGPKIIEASRNAPQPWTCGEKISLKNILFRNTIDKPWNKNEIQQVDWVSGTALFISKSLFDKLGGFDENFFMYFEDQDLCLRGKLQGLKVFFYPHTQIIHYNGKSWNDKKNQKEEYYKSQKYFFEKYHSKLSNRLLRVIHSFKGS